MAVLSNCSQTLPVLMIPNFACSGKDNKLRTTLASKMPMTGFLSRLTFGFCFNASTNGCFE